MINIVCLTRDRKILFDQTIESLYANTPKGSFTLTIVDDSSNPPVKISRPGLWVVNLASSLHVLSQLKSLGVAWSEQTFKRGDWLSIIDNDCFFKSSWSEKMIRLANETEPLGFRLWGGQNHPFHWKFATECSLPSGLKFGDNWTLAGTHMFMRWNTWDTFKSTLQSSRPGPCAGEDVKFCKAIKAAGWKIGTPLSSDEYVIDCGLRQTDGSESPGMSVKQSIAERKVKGVIFA